MSLIAFSSLFLRTHREIFSESFQSKPNLDCNYHCPIDLVPNRSPFGVKSVGKWLIQAKIPKKFHRVPEYFLCDLLFVPETKLIKYQLRASKAIEVIFMRQEKIYVYCEYIFRYKITYIQYKYIF